jgi:hypothetical protein
MRCFFWILLFVAFARGADDRVAEWKAYSIGGLSFQLPKRWADGAVETRGAPDGTVFAAEVPNQGLLRIRVLQGSGATAIPRKNTEDVLNAPSWADLLETIKAQGYEFEEGGPARSRIVDGVSQDSLVVATKHNGVRKGFRLMLWTTPEKIIRAELTYTRRMSRNEFGDTMDLWAGLKHDRAAAGAVANAASARTATPLSGINAASGPAAALTAAPSTVRAKARSVAELVQDFSESLVFIEGGSGSGSGFICKTPEGTFLYTNQHVVAGMPRVTCTRLGGAAVKIGGAFAAAGHDEMRFVTDPPALPFESGAQIETFAKIGDEVVVLGNSEGSRVISPLRGKLVGIGPDRIEVDAQFVPGNSGSPIIHVPSGKVIGIATYLIRRRYTDLVDKKEPAIRRFGYRLDSVKQWQPVNWAAYQSEHEALGKVVSLTADFARLLDDVAKDGKLDASQHRNSGLGRIVLDLDRALGRQAMSLPDRERVFQNFVGSLRSATQADIAGARSRLRYDFFIRQLNEEASMRDEFYRIFDKSAKASLR